jgi:glycosyltransferase involved in cell wall biosynthesis
LFVNDGSIDGTQRVLAEMCLHASGRLSYINMPVNSGKAEAVRAGLLAAMKGHPRQVGFWDADLATPLAAIPLFRDCLDRREASQVVIGTRVPLLGRSIQRRPVRRLLGGMFSLAASAVLGVRVRDTQCGAKLFRVTPALVESLQRTFLSRWIFDVELLLRLLAGWRGDRHCAQLSVFEFVLDEWNDVKGSKLRPFDFVRAFFELAALWRQYRWGGKRGAALPEVTVILPPLAPEERQPPSKRKAA